jgi:glutathione synthase/RimK-type ligase-like ATP-grasp enzyme
MADLVGVLREPEFSPGRVADDAAILERTRDALAARGLSMTLGGAELLGDEAPRAVLAMCQSDAALAALDRAALTLPVVNHPDAIRACYRHETVRRLATTHVPFPPTRLVSTADNAATTAAAAPCWVKRGDVHAMASSDVVFAERPDDVTATLADFANRGIARAALQAHVPGVVVKFYGIADGRFFRCFTDQADVPAPIPRLWEAASAGANALGLEVFGGDLVVTADGRAVLVDLNDWPSFARCRDEAAEAIAGYVVERTLAAHSHSRQDHHGTEARS